MNHRCGQRFSTDRAIRIRMASGAVSLARLRDVSVSGAMIGTVLDLPYMSRVKVQFVHGYDGDGSTREVDAHVTRKTAEGTGIEWDELNPEAVEELIGSLCDMPQVAGARGEPDRLAPATSQESLAMLPGLPTAYYRLH